MLAVSMDSILCLSPYNALNVSHYALEFFQGKRPGRRATSGGGDADRA